MPTISYHDVAIRVEGKLALTVCNKSEKPDIQGTARVFDLREKKQLAEFPVRHECPGSGMRLALSREELFCFVGCYDVYGIGCYSLSDGKEIWRRKDLKSVQIVNSLEFQNLVFCGRQTGAAHLLSARTGETVEKLKGVEGCFGSPFDETMVIVGRSLEIHRPLGRKLVTWKPTEKFCGFCYFTPNEVLFLEHDSIRCYDLSAQQLIWSHQPVAKMKLPSRFIFNEAAGCFQMFQIRESGAYIVSLDRRSGELIRELKLAEKANGGFCLDGNGLFNTHLCLFSAKTGKLLHDFTTDIILAQDPAYKTQLIRTLAANPRSLAELEEYMKTEGFSVPDIKKALFIRTYENLAKRRKENQ